MLEDYKEKNRIIEETEKLFSCEHERSELVKKYISKGGVQFVYQCVRCGDKVSNPISRDKVHSLLGGAPAKEFDEDLRKEWLKKKRELLSSRLGHLQKKRASDYKNYLLSDKWKKKRQLVFRRANGVCEGCYERMAMQVHHLTYDHIGDEFLFELSAVCEQCHKRLHQENENDYPLEKKDDMYYDETDDIWLPL